MNTLIDIQEQLLDTGNEIARLTSAIAAQPESLALQAMAKAVRKRHTVLEQQFQMAADSIGVDVCSYRIFADRGQQPTIKGLTNALSQFQTLVSVVYDAVKHSIKKERTRVSASAVIETTFQFGYSFPGSVGFVLTIPNERLLIGESALDDSIRIIFDMAKAQSHREIREFANNIGSASVKAMYDWAASHSAHGLGADIEWRREQNVRASLLAQWPELEALHNIIDETGEETTEEVSIVGRLVAADLGRKTFRIELPDQEEVRGTFVDAISPARAATLPSQYRADLTKHTRLHYATDKTVVSFFLHRLEGL